MPFFFLIPLWALCVMAGLALLFSGRLRFVGIYIMFAATGGLLGSFLLSTALLLLSAKLFGGTRVAWLALAAYLGGIVLGGLVGVLAGLLIAWKINVRFGWQGSARAR